MDVRLRELYLLFRCYEVRVQYRCTVCVNHIMHITCVCAYTLMREQVCAWERERGGEGGETAIHEFTKHYFGVSDISCHATSNCMHLLQGYEGSFLKLISSKPGKPPQVRVSIGIRSFKGFNYFYWWHHCLLVHAQLASTCLWWSAKMIITLILSCCSR